MMNGDKKPPVYSELRKQWLRRIEEYGETPPYIATDEGYDVRTVRKQLDIAQREKEMREAKNQVLRSAIEEHYRDLCNIAKKLDSRINAQSPYKLPADISDDRLYRALKEHLPRSPLWKLLERWNKSTGEYHSTIIEIEERVKDEIAVKQFNLPESDDDYGYSILGLKGFIVFNETSYKPEYPSFKDSNQISVKPSPSNYNEIMLGAYILARCKPEDNEDYIAKASKFLDEAEEWDVSKKLRSTVQSITDLAISIKDELAVITLRRIVPGKCKYCPM